MDLGKYEKKYFLSNDLSINVIREEAFRYQLTFVDGVGK